MTIKAIQANPEGLKQNLEKLKNSAKNMNGYDPTFSVIKLNKSSGMKKYKRLSGQIKFADENYRLSVWKDEEQKKPVFLDQTLKDDEHPYLIQNKNETYLIFPENPDKQTVEMNNILNAYYYK